MRDLTAGEECQQAAKTMSTFVDLKQGSIPALLVRECMGLAIIRGTKGVAVIRLPTGDWSAPCAIALTSAHGNVQDSQESILLFMTEASIYSLVTRAKLSLNETHRFAPGPLNVPPSGSSPVDVYVYVRFNGGFTPPDLIASHMIGWIVNEDTERHGKWHGESVTWFDVLTNKISVDRSSVGNALYVVLNLAAGSASESAKSSKKNYADLEQWTAVAPSVVKKQQISTQEQQSLQYQQLQQNGQSLAMPIQYSQKPGGYPGQGYTNASYSQQPVTNPSVLTTYQGQSMSGYYDPNSFMYSQQQFQQPMQQQSYSSYAQPVQPVQPGMSMGYPQQGGYPQQSGQPSSYPPYYQQQ